MNAGAECFVCFDKSESDLIGGICNCSGRFVHKTCLEKTLEVNSHSRGKCPICTQSYLMDIKTYEECNQYYVYFMSLKLLGFSMSMISFGYICMSSLIGGPEYCESWFPNITFSYAESTVKDCSIFIVNFSIILSVLCVGSLIYMHANRRLVFIPRSFTRYKLSI